MNMTMIRYIRGWGLDEFFLLKEKSMTQVRLIKPCHALFV